MSWFRATDTTAIAEPASVPIAVHHALIRSIFSAPTLDEILSRLQRHATAGHAFARETAIEIAKRSPFALALTFWMLSGGQLPYPEQPPRCEHNHHLSGGLLAELARVHDLEYRVAVVIGQIPESDFVEGVRATLVRKSEPQWRQAPSDVERVIAEAVKVPFLELDADVHARIFGQRVSKAWI